MSEAIRNGNSNEGVLRKAKWIPVNITCGYLTIALIILSLLNDFAPVA
jgi:hypothetical protein